MSPEVPESQSAEEQPSAGPGPGGPDEGAPAAAGSAAEELAAERERLAGELAEKTRQHLRALADHDNYRKRVARERQEISAAAKRELVAEILPALDALNLAIRHASEASSAEGLLEGVTAARDALERALVQQGAERIPASGGFDPDLHCVQAAVERDDLPDGEIIEELRPGYRFGKLVVRHSEVVVAKRPAGKAESRASEEPEAGN
jgi:molecular chaperone GrpE